MKPFNTKFLGFLVCLVLVIWYLISLTPSGEMEIYLLDIGQGDAILIKTVDNKYVLVDSGPDEKVLRELQEVIPFWDRKIDLVILTHPDQDHVGGMPYVFGYYDVSEVSYLDVQHDNWAYSEFEYQIANNEISNLQLHAEKDFRFGCCTYFDVLWPTEKIYNECSVGQGNEGKCGLDVNDTSLAFVLIYKDFEMYFGGDLASEFEERIFVTNKYNLDVIKVGHHGSKTSTSEEFLRLVTPESAYISVGEDNKFNHPDEQVVSRLEEMGIKVYRTDVDGRVMIRL